MSNLRLPAEQHSDQLMWYPCGLSLRDLLGAGTSGFAGRLDAAVKWTLPNNVHFIERERKIYERLGSYHGILRYYGPVENGILLEFAHHGSIRQYRMNHEEAIPPTTKLRWIQQVTSTMCFLHSRGVLHADISCNNIFLDQNLNAKVADFAGSVIDGEPYLSCYESSHSHPNIQGVCVQSEIFALGSTFYEIVTGSKPYSNLSINEIEEAYSLDEFPRLDGLDICHSIIAKCWGRRYTGIESLLRDIETEVEASKTKNQSVVVAFPYATLPKAIVVLCLVPAVIWLRAQKR
ncbi:spindle assembly checkpoint kinase [Amniculicola lignicola CBS 123094]|uniref:EKC/KEOPS complex subunit BUD32 n=1 Tax=Amniculicola lignicola CBS 123094 TaxID=1392246 RepID=A0A6A5W1N8_9PLEO|nr:spindle assembly checkpoint kinase [Amniculicola lignicola CBS 123094]